MAFDDLYREIILDHSRHPRNRENLDRIPDDLIMENPTCGDSIKISVETDLSGKILQVLFDGEGCAVSTSSASMMTELLMGKTIREAVETAEKFIRIMNGNSEETLEGWGEIEAMDGVRLFPQRVKCATLPWHAAKKTLKAIL